MIPSRAGGVLLHETVHGERTADGGRGRGPGNGSGEFRTFSTIILPVLAVGTILSKYIIKG